MRSFVNLFSTAGFRVVIAIALIGLVGCAASGPKYEEPEAIPSGQGLVYIYRPSKAIGGGVSFDIHTGTKEEDHEVTTLKNGGYFPLYTPPSELTLWAKTESEASVTLDVKEGETYYVKGTVGVGFFVGRPRLEVVDSETGAREVKECNLLPAKNM
jgi:hypothetical protein